MKHVPVIHRRYAEYRNRPDLRALAKCDNINGPICGPDQLTSDDRSVTCGRCLRILKLPRVERLGWAAEEVVENARRIAFEALDEPHGVIATRILEALGVTKEEIHAHEWRRRPQGCE